MLVSIRRTVSVQITTLRMTNELHMQILIKDIRVAENFLTEAKNKLNSIATYDYVCDDCGSFNLKFNLAPTYNCKDCGCMYNGVIGKKWRLKDGN